MIIVRPLCNDMKIIELRRFRKKMNLSQVQLAQATGYRQSFISDLEQCKRELPDAFIEKLKEAYPDNDVNSYVHEDGYMGMVNVPGQGLVSKDITLLRALEMLSKAQDEATQALRQYNEVLQENALLKVEIERLKGENKVLKNKHGIA